jgi:hypothetical protein
MKPVRTHGTPFASGGRAQYSAQSSVDMRAQASVSRGPRQAENAGVVDTAEANSPQKTSRVARGNTSCSAPNRASNAGNRKRRPRNQESWRSVDVAPEHDIRILKPASLPRGKRFETAEDAAEYDAIRIAGLINARPDLAAEIERREERGVIPATPISARDARDFRVADIAERLRIAGEYEGPHEISTIYLGAYPAGLLHSFDLKRAHGSLRKKLARAGFGGAILTGGTEVAWINKHGLWIPHCHILSIGVEKLAWESLRKMLPDAGPAVALKVQDLVDLLDQLSYCQKFNSTHMPGKRSPTDRAPAIPLPRERLEEWAGWMFKYRLEELGFNYGCRRRGGHIVPDA